MEELQLGDVAGALGDRARAAIVLELLGGEPRPAAALARSAGIAPSTASAHLARLESAGLITVERAGRRCMHRLAGHEVAEAVEALMLVAPGAPVLGLRAANRATAHRAARSCYDHLAGRFGAALRGALLERGWVRRRRRGRALVVTPARAAGLREALGLEIDPHAPATPERAAA